MAVKRCRKLTEEEREILKQVIREKSEAGLVRGDHGGYLIHYANNYIMGQSVFPGVARDLYKTLEEDERLDFLKEIMSRANKTGVDPEHAINRGYDKLFDEMINALEAHVNEALDKYVFEQRRKYEESSLEERKQRIAEIEERVQVPVRFDFGNSSK